jgi:hypothetical protein
MLLKDGRLGLIDYGQVKQLGGTVLAVLLDSYKSELLFGACANPHR